MDLEMEDVHDITDPCVSKGLEYCGMGEGLEEGEFEGPPQISNFKAFRLATFEARDKADRLAKTEIWEENLKRGKARNKLTGSVEEATRTRKLQVEVPLIASTPSPSPQDSMYNNTRQGSVDFEMGGWTEEEREQDIHDGMYGDAYEDIYGDCYWGANVDIHEENLVSESLSRTRRKKTNRRKQRKKAKELQASLQTHGLLPVPVKFSLQPLQKKWVGTASHRDDTALRPKPNNNQQEVREQEVGMDITIERTDYGVVTLQHERLKKIADLRKRIMVRKALLQTQGPQKKYSSQHITKSPKTYQVRLQEQRDKVRGKTQQSTLVRQKSYENAASPPQSTQNNSQILCRSHENDAPTSLQQEKDATVEKCREPSTSIPDEIRVLIEREKERRQRLLALDNVELAKKRKEKQDQELSAPERIRLSIESTKSRSVPFKVFDVAEKINLEKVPKRVAFLEKGSPLHAPSALQQPLQNNPSVHSHESREVSQFEREQGYNAPEEVDNGEFLPVLKDSGFIPENVNMEIDPIIEHGDQEDVAKLFSIPQNIGDILDNARRCGTKTGEVMQEASLRSDAMIEDMSKDIWPRAVSEILSHLLFMSEELEEIINMEYEWFGCLGMDADIATDIEDLIDPTTPSPSTTIEYPSEPEDTTPRTTSDILSELFTISEDIEDMINTENEWFGWLGMDIDIKDIAEGL
ncbi:hypothetical protein BOTCAL_0185g00230 [Botryotinia calthae]|uniref:Uncharacterized protein n=1 Tax=Botryotinia calthae TaxID=38488 RepID=A0A4Y8D089_9HELO|nr:hypothetical protein BOTCAL_0185g00230 [Botryotinia calthae]